MYTIPIQVPPGTAGMEPKLALVYNSQAGNGGLGVGWSLSGLSSISRCGRTIAQDGVNTGVTYDNNDRYCLDGQRLVMISPSGTYGGDGVEYRTERESFTKVISHGQVPAPGNGPLWFEARTKSGQIFEYGNTVDSRIEAQGKTSVRIYQVNKISDRKGNYLTVTYQEDNANGDYRPTRIDYTGNTAAGVAPYASVQFYWDIRDDVSAIYVGGSVIKTQKLLSAVQTYIGTTPVKYYSLTYTGTTGDPSRVGAVLECNGDSTSCLPTRWNTWQVGTGSSNVAAPVNWGNPSPYAPRTLPVLADINGDGLADLVYASEWSGSPSILVQFSSNGGGFSDPLVVGSADRRSDGTWDLNSVAVADVNGDGRADVITVLGENGGNVRTAQTRTPDLITQFDNGLGASTTVTYKPLTDSTVYAKDTNAAWPLRDLLQQGPLYVVSNSSTTNGAGGSNVMNYFYTGGKAHLQGGGFLGFRTMTATDVQTSIKTTTTFRQDYPFQGLPTQFSKTQSSGAMLNQVTNTWTDTLTPSSTGKYHRSDLTQTVKQSNDLNGAALPTVTTLLVYDAYGNPTSIAASAADGFSKSIANVYTNDNANWLLGKLTQSQVTSTTPTTP
jgi:hypothetical protein